MSSPSIVDAFNQLQAAHNQLTYAIFAFHNACAMLHQAVLKPHTSPVDHSWLEHKLSQLTDEIDSLGVTEGKLAQSRALLRRSMNTSKSLVPINILPPEVLSRIFEHAVRPLACSGPGNKNLQLHPLVVIPSVSASWRQLAINTPSLWTHIDVLDGYTSPHPESPSKGTIDRAFLWLKRARNTPIHLDFQSSRISHDYELVEELKTLVTRAASFTFSSDSDSLHAQKIFDLYASCDQPERLKTIVFRGTVSMANVRINWSTCAPHTLTTLDVRNLSKKVAPNLDELVDLLSSAPGLQTLLLQTIHILLGQRSHYPEIRLLHLKYLEIMLLKGATVMEHLISSIVPGSCELNVRLEIPGPDHSQANTTLQQFIQRSHITCIYLNRLLHNGSAWLARHLDHLTELRALRLNFLLDPSCAGLAALTTTVGERHLARCPKLRTLCIVEALIDSAAQEQLKRVVRAYTLDRIIMGAGAFFADESGARCDESEMLGWLGERVNTVVFDEDRWFEVDLDDL